MVTVYYTWVPDNLEGPREGRWLMALPPAKRDVIARMRFAKGRAASLLVCNIEIRHASVEI